jgi:hypothetical protein
MEADHINVSLAGVRRRLGRHEAARGDATFAGRLSDRLIRGDCPSPRPSKSELSLVSSPNEDGVRGLAAAAELPCRYVHRLAWQARQQGV